MAVSCLIFNLREEKKLKKTIVAFAFLMLANVAVADKQLLWGDTHVHTSDSFDAILFGNRSADPEVAYRFARGEPVIHPYSLARVQLHTPLDFLVIADHAETLGVAKEIFYNGTQLEDAGLIASIKAKVMEYFLRDLIGGEVDKDKISNLLPEGGDPREMAANNWTDKAGLPNADALIKKSWLGAIKQADRFNEPGVFSALIGWEWGSTPGGANLHRVVVSNADAESASQFIPLGAQVSPYPEDLWSFLEQTSAETGIDFLAIPHNSNVSKGFMFAETTLRGDPFSDEYMQRRARWEKLVEITQVKGDSETYPVLSPRDEFADFELFPYYVQGNPQPYVASRGDYVRPALITGIKFDKEQGINPFKLGIIGSSDVHTGLASTEEDNFSGKLAVEGTPEGNNQMGTPGENVTGWSMSASGLAAVWAQDNTRQAIFDAMQRREVYGTTGPRVSLRLFAGYDFNEQDVDSEDFAAIGYSKGVPMGGDLLSNENSNSPQLMIQALKDPREANLDRVQVIKGWVDDNGESHEVIYNVAWSDNRKLDSEGKLPSVGNTVNLRTGKTANSIGATQLSAFWQDPDFNPQQHAFYYVRVLQIPTARHTLLDAIALGLDEPPEGASTLQERAYSSPVWYIP